MNDYPEGTIYIQLQGVYDGTCVYKLPDGTLINRFKPGERAYQVTQDFIDKLNSGEDELP